jgi:hypothetical protein
MRSECGPLNWRSFLAARARATTTVARLAFVLLSGCASSAVVDLGDASIPPLQDASVPDAAMSLDAAADVRDALADAGREAAALSPSGSCAVDLMTQLYAGVLPTNPYAKQPPASQCVKQAHDVIVVLGCPSKTDGSPASCQTKRADIAVALSQAGYASRFITSGAAVHNAHVEADALANLLVARGIPSANIVKEPRAMHTDENIYYSSRIMQDQGWTTALVVSDDPGHLIMSAVCDANCCVELGRLTVFEFPVWGGSEIAGHYALVPPGTVVSTSECEQIQQALKLMCTNLSSRLSCKDDFKLKH